MSTALQIHTPVISINDDRPMPLVGYVLDWLDEDRVAVAWGDSIYSDTPWDEARIEYADQLTTHRNR